MSKLLSLPLSRVTQLKIKIVFIVSPFGGLAIALAALALFAIDHDDKFRLLVWATIPTGFGLFFHEKITNRYRTRDVEERLDELEVERDVQAAITPYRTAHQERTVKRPARSNVLPMIPRQQDATPRAEPRSPQQPQRKGKASLTYGQAPYPYRQSRDDQNQTDQIRPATMGVPHPIPGQEWQVPTSAQDRQKQSGGGSSAHHETQRARPGDLFREDHQ